jgi:hypothetical protein
VQVMPAGTSSAAHCARQTGWPRCECEQARGRLLLTSVLPGLCGCCWAHSYVGELLVASEARRREDSLYLLDIDDSYTIDSMRRGNISRFFNHSCQPVRSARPPTPSRIPGGGRVIHA